MPEKPYLIGIAGGSCSGKTSIARELVQLFPPETAAALELDSYYHDLSNLPIEKRRKTNFDHPEALEWTLLMTQVLSLAEGAVVVPPNYNFETQIRRNGTSLITPHKIVVLEGLFAFYEPKLRAVLDTKVFVELDDTTRLQRRLARDTRERGHSTKLIRTQYCQTVRPMFEKYILPTRRFADLIVRGDDPVNRAANNVLEHIENCQNLNLIS